jgi:hypothetical protein
MQNTEPSKNKKPKTTLQPIAQAEPLPSQANPMQTLSKVKFIQAVQIIEETWYCDTKRFDISFDTATSLVVVAEKKHPDVKTMVPLTNVVYFQVA